MNSGHTPRTAYNTLYDMVLIDGPRIVIKLRLPDKQHHFAKKDGFRLLYLVYKDCDEVGFLDIYPKNGPMQQLDEDDGVFATLCSRKLHNLLQM